MAKQKESKQKESAEQSGEEFFNANQGKIVKLADPSHALPQAESETPKRPEVKDPSHLKPQE